MTSSRPALSFGRKYCRTTPPDPTRSDLRCHDRSTRVPVISYRPLQIFCRAGPQIVATVELLRWEDAIQRLGHAQCFFTGSMGRSHEQYGNCLTDPAMTPYFKQCRYKYDTHRDGDFVTLTNQRVASVIANKPFFSFWRDGGYFWPVACTGSAWLWPAGGGTVGLRYRYGIGDGKFVLFY